MCILSLSKGEKRYPVALLQTCFFPMSKRSIEAESVPGPSAPTGTQTLARGLAVLEAVAGGAHELSALSRVVGTSRSTTHRLASCLVQERYLRFSASCGYVLGPKLIELGFQAHAEVSLATLARPYLEKLADVTSDTVHLAQIDGGEVLYLDKIPGKRGLEMRSRVGHRMPLASTGIGKALILGCSEQEWADIYRRAAPGGDEDPAWGRFVERMRQYARGGYAFDLEDNEPSICCVAAPVCDASQKITAAISVSSTAHYMPRERMESLIEVVKQAAAEISSELGAVIIPAAVGK
jgi:DNA-binding IclR family transcriptional regulator